MQHQLVVRQRLGPQVRLVWEDDAVCAFPQCLFEDGDELGRLRDQAVGELLIVVYEIVDVDVAVKLLEQRILLELVSAAMVS